MLEQRSVQLPAYVVDISKLAGAGCLEIPAVAIAAVCQLSSLQAHRSK